MIEVKAYKCDYCSMVSIYKGNVKRHERSCYLNPNNKTCATCGNFYIDEVDRNEPRFGEDYCYQEKVFTCDEGLGIANRETKRDCEKWIKKWI